MVSCFSEWHSSCFSFVVSLVRSFQKGSLVLHSCKSAGTILLQGTKAWRWTSQNNSQNNSWNHSRNKLLTCSSAAYNALAKCCAVLVSKQWSSLFSWCFTFSILIGKPTSLSFSNKQLLKTKVLSLNTMIEKCRLPMASPRTVTLEVGRFLTQFLGWGRMV